MGVKVHQSTQFVGKQSVNIGLTVPQVYSGGGGRAGGDFDTYVGDHYSAYAEIIAVTRKGM